MDELVDRLAEDYCTITLQKLGWRLTTPAAVVHNCDANVSCAAAAVFRDRRMDGRSETETSHKQQC